MKVRIKKVHTDAILPEYQTAGAACFDLHSVEGGAVTPHDPSIFRTGLVFEVPAGYVMLVYSRSGHGFKDDIRLSNCTGVIDEDFRGEVKVKLASDKSPSAGLFGYSQEKFIVKPGDRIAQAIILSAPRCGLEWADNLSETVRGDKGIGSTGA